jgi:hypothetical protein
MKTLIGNIRTSSDTPIHYLYERGHHWESLRAHYHTQQGRRALAREASELAAAYDAAWQALPETAHRSAMPKHFK